MDQSVWFDTLLLLTLVPFHTQHIVLLDTHTQQCVTEVFLKRFSFEERADVWNGEWMLRTRPFDGIRQTLPARQVDFPLNLCCSR